MEEDLLISVEIADRIYKVRVSRKEEEVFRKAVNVVKTKTKEYADMFAYKDKQDLLAMVLLQYLTSYIKLEDQQNFFKENLFVKLEEIENLLEEDLNK